jgi:hypothetical protein
MLKLISLLKALSQRQIKIGIGSPSEATTGN